MADREIFEPDKEPPSLTLGRRSSLSEVDSSSEDDFEGRQNGDVRLALLSKSSRPTHKPGPSGALGRKNETTASLVRGILKEAAPTLFATVIGMVVTGELLERISTWQALKQHDELFITIPMLNNMKGNLEMNLSARLSTAANTGGLDDVAVRRTLVFGSLSLLQVQAILMSILAATVSFGLGEILPAPEIVLPSKGNSTFVLRDLGPAAIANHPFWLRGVSRPAKMPLQRTKSGIKEFFTVLAITFASASASALILGSFMCSVIIICRRYNLNPDNISTPLASCLGDLITLTLFSFMAAFVLLPSLSSHHISALILVFVTIILVLATFAAFRNRVSRPLISQGWTPLVCAMVVSSGTGLVLDKFVTRWEGFGALAIVISGLPGSIGSIFVSRLSTELHASPFTLAYTSPGKKNFITSVILGLVSLPVVFAYLAFVCAAGWLNVPSLLLFIYVITFCVSTAFSLGLAYLLTHFLWSRDLDPDSYCLPIHSSIVDLVGQCLLVVAYLVSSGLGADVKLKSSS